MGQNQTTWPSHIACSRVIPAGNNDRRYTHVCNVHTDSKTTLINCTLQVNGSAARFTQFPDLGGGLYLRWLEGYPRLFR